MIADILKDAQANMAKSVDFTREDLVTIRTGRANPNMFNGLSAEFYGQMTPLNQMATVTAPEPRMLLVKPYDTSTMDAIEDAIRNSDLGVNPTNDGQVLRVTIPQLTEERRKEMVKLAKSKGEDGKIAIRQIRRRGMEAIEKLDKDGDVGEDEARQGEKDLDKITADYVAQVDEVVANKEKELMEV